MVPHEVHLNVDQENVDKTKHNLHCNCYHLAHRHPPSLWGKDTTNIVYIPFRITLYIERELFAAIYGHII